MKRITLTLLTLLGFCSQIAAQDTDNTNRLWDNKPAKIWQWPYRRYDIRRTARR